MADAIVVSRIAEQSGFETHVAKDASAFFEALVDWFPTHVALGLILPQADGVEVLRSLAKRRCKAAIILMGGAGRRILDAATRYADDLRLNVVGVLSKPVDPPLLRQLLLKPLVAPGLTDPAPGALELTSLGEAEIARALRAEEFVLHFQPKIEFVSGHTTGFEAMARWGHPRLGQIRPDTFVPMIEGSPYAAEFTRTIFVLALQWARDACAATGLTISVNLFAKNLDDIAIADDFEQLCREYEVAPESVILELTETGTTVNRPTAINVLTRLRLKGFKLSMDDFGTGYASMARLARFPFSEIKIDKSFILAMKTSPDAIKIVDSMIHLGRRLSLTTVAEGVEDARTAQWLTKMGCMLGQGYHYSRPLDPQAARAWIATQRAQNKSATVAKQLREATPSLSALKSAFDILPDAVCLVDAAGRFVFVNAAGEDVFGYPPEDMVGMSMLDLIYPDDMERTLNAAGDVLAGRRLKYFENRYVRKDGSVAKILWCARWSEEHQLRIAVAREVQ